MKPENPVGASLLCAFRAGPCNHGAAPTARGSRTTCPLTADEAALIVVRFYVEHLPPARIGLTANCFGIANQLDSNFILRRTGMLVNITGVLPLDK